MTKTERRILFMAILTVMAWLTILDVRTSKIEKAFDGAIAAMVQE